MRPKGIDGFLVSERVRVPRSRLTLSELQEVFSELISTKIAPGLKAKGFVRRGRSFVRRIGKNSEIVYCYAERVRSVETRLLFGVDLGIISSRLWWFETGRLQPTRLPLPSDCHLWESLSRLIPEPQRPPERDWWSIASPEDIERRGAVVRDALEGYGMPWLDRFVSDEALRDLYIQGRGGSELQVHYRLAYLLLTIGPDSMVDDAIARLRTASAGMPWEHTANEYADRMAGYLKAR